MVYGKFWRIKHCLTCIKCPVLPGHNCMNVYVPNGRPPAAPPFPFKQNILFNNNSPLWVFLKQIGSQLCSLINCSSAVRVLGPLLPKFKRYKHGVCTNQKHVFISYWIYFIFWGSVCIHFFKQILETYFVSLWIIIQLFVIVTVMHDHRDL